MKKYSKWALIICVALSLSGCSANKSILDSENPTQIVIWHYYNGPQKIAFDDMVFDFNETQGKKQGIVVEAFSQGSINELNTKVSESITNKIGSDKAPNAFMAYSDTAYEYDVIGSLANLSKYFSKKELAEYIPSYIEEGYLINDNELKIFPIAKATESFLINMTDFEPFVAATNTTLDELKTIEGIAKVAERYYNYTDGLTETLNDGKAFFGRDAMANLFIIGSIQLGQEIFDVKNNQVNMNINKSILKRFWDNYYVPYINGHFAANGRYRSDEAKTGEIIALIGSNSGAYYFPTEVTDSEDYVYPIESAVLPLPHFEEGEEFAIQQGAGVVVLKGSEQEEFACSEFLKWFSESKRNIEFALLSGYLPVKSAANDMALINEVISEKNIVVTDWKLSIIEEAINTVKTNTMYATRAFKNGNQARSVLENSLNEKAKKDYLSVIEMISNGSTKEEAVKKFSSDENFELWVNTFEEALNNLE